jgi:hypothetical protein
VPPQSLSPSQYGTALCVPPLCIAVRALQLGLSAVPRVDPRVLRTLEQYTNIYREW